MIYEFSVEYLSYPEFRLVNFLNVFLKPKIPIKSVVLLNPYNDKEFHSDKLSIVDIKAEDENGNIYQIEMQIGNKPNLRNRIFFTWSQIYSKQIKTGESVRKLNPVIAIWLLTENLIPDNRFHHIVEARFRHNKKLFIDHMEIHLLELNKWRPPKRFSKKHLWPYIFNGPHEKFELPQLFKDPIMRRVMAELREISEKEIKWHRYLSRQLYLHDEATRQEALDTLEEIQEKLSITKEQLGATKEQLGATKEQLGATKEQLGFTEEKLDQTEQELLQSKQREAQLLEQIAKLQAKNH